MSCKNQKASFIVLSFFLLLLSSCEMMPDWIGGGEDGEKLKGTRVGLLESSSGVTKDAGLDEVNVVLPQEQKNTRWYKSSGFHILTGGNPRAASSFTEQDSVSVGSGASGGGHLRNTPIVANNILYVLDGVGRVSAYDANNIDKKLWQHKIDLPKSSADYLNGGISYEDGIVYVTTGSNLIVALDASSGQVKWQRNINAVLRSAPEIRGGMIYVNSLANTLYVLKADDGSIVWTHNGIQEDLGIAGAASPIVQSEIVYVGYSSGEIYALKASDGTPVWGDSLALSSSATNAYLLSDIDADPVIDGNRIYSISSAGVMVASDLFTGARVWEQEVSSGQTPWVASGFIYILSESEKTQLVCIHAATGRVKWVLDLEKYKNPEKKKGNIYYRGPVMAGNRLLVVSSVGKLLSINPFNGEQISSYDVPDNIYAAPIVANDRIFLLNDNAKLTSLSGIISSGVDADPIVEEKLEPSAGELGVLGGKSESSLVDGADSDLHPSAGLETNSASETDSPKKSSLSNPFRFLNKWF